MVVDEESEPISLRWKGDRVDGVFVANDWQESVTPTELVAMAVSQFREQRPSRGSWRSQVRLRDIPLDQMDEFVAAVRAARKESPVQEPSERRTQHFTSRWHRGDLLSIQADSEWMVQANRQQISDELLDLFDVPVTEPDGPAVTWLMRMMGVQR